MLTFKQFVSEGINDKGLLKAIFVVGLPGAGKSYTIGQLKGPISPKIVNTDKAAEFLSTKWKKDITSDSWADFKDKSHKMTYAMLQSYIDGMLPLFVDGTSNDISNILHRIGILESVGYDVGVVFVSASLETSIRRANERAAKIGRHVDEDFIKHVYDRNKENAAYLKSKVSFFRMVENDTDELDDKGMMDAFKKVQDFFNSPLDNPVGKRNIEQLKLNSQKYLSPSIISSDALAKKITGWYKS